MVGSTDEKKSIINTTICNFNAAGYLVIYQMCIILIRLPVLYFLYNTNYTLQPVLSRLAFLLADRNVRDTSVIRIKIKENGKRVRVGIKKAINSPNCIK